MGLASLFSEIDLFEDTEEKEGALQMATDEVLFRSIKSPLLRHYRWKGAWVSFGYFQKWQEVQQAFPNRSLVRRWSGGGAVEHIQDWTFSLIIPSTYSFWRLAPATSYAEIHLRLKMALSHFFQGVREVEGEKEQQATDVGNPCFLNPRRNDLCYEGKKVAGGAQRRSFYGLLHQGSIQYLALPSSFARIFAAQLAAHTRSFSPSKFIRDEAIKLAKARYKTQEWLQKI